MLSTVFLAKKYGLVDTITKDSKNNSSTITHLLVIDFESTCWKDIRRPPEIIEFPVVLMELSNGTVLEEFHQYVMPTENPKLSTFCVDFTGISQEQVDAAVPLKTCLMLFQQWFQQTSVKYNFSSVALVSWSDWDFGVCLHQECNRKAIFKPDLFNRWIDLRALYKEHMKCPSQGLKKAVQSMGLMFEGREHSGIWDARNTARLAWKLHEDGLKLRITKDIGPKC